MRLARRTRGFEAPLTCSTGTFTPFNSASTLIALSAFEYPVPAQAASAAVLVYRSGEATGVATVNYATADGTATAGTDYSAVSGSFTWVPGDTSGRVFYVPVTRGAAGKQFKVRLTSV
ncbi:MAG TPA: Calx-beta domain-containing protein, partial [Steroidobacteraceae bacterium]|nr:Calx-beta domain-containing protein [Steroidobacteraceae bacterium]